jgi:glycine/serine hydroxymethyltransferase
MKQIAAWIHRALENKDDNAALAQIRSEVSATNARFPLP